MSSFDSLCMHIRAQGWVWACCVVEKFGCFIVVRIGHVECSCLCEYKLMEQNKHDYRYNIDCVHQLLFTSRPWVHAMRLGRMSGQGNTFVFARNLASAQRQHNNPASNQQHKHYSTHAPTAYSKTNTTIGPMKQLSCVFKMPPIGCCLCCCCCCQLGKKKVLHCRKVRDVVRFSLSSCIHGCSWS